MCLKVIPVTIGNKVTHKKVKTYALLDNCSDVTLCSDGLVSELMLDGEKTEYSLSTVNSESEKMSGLDVSFYIEPIDGTEKIDVDHAWTVKEIPVSNENIPTQNLINRFPHLEGLHFPEVQEKEVTVLIGANIPQVFWTLEERRGSYKEPVAVRSPLGWTLIGPTGQRTSSRKPSVNLIVNTKKEEEDNLQNQLERMWRTDFNDRDITLNKTMSIEDNKALKIMQNSVKSIDGHYQLDLSWSAFRK